MKNLYAKDNFNLQSGFLLDPQLEGLEAIFMISEQTKNCKQIDHFRLQHVIIKKKKPVTRSFSRINFTARKLQRVLFFLQHPCRVQWSEYVRETSAKTDLKVFLSDPSLTWIAVLSIPVKFKRSE